MVGRTEGLDFCTVRSGRRAIDMLRMLSFDLVVVGMRIPDLSTWDFVRRVRTGWAWQKWALVGGAITEQQEITARMFGSVKIYDVMPSSDEVLQLASHLREKAALSVLNQTYDRNYRSAAAF
jgi:DNA-binding response OmpR family regulator